MIRTLRGILRTPSAVISLGAVSGLSILASLNGFLFQVVLAARFGTGATVDSYFFAISIPIFVAGLASATLSYSLVPVLVLADRDPGARADILRSVARRSGALACGFIALGLPATMIQPWLLPHSASLRQIPELPLMIFLGWVIAAAQFFSSLFTVELNAGRRPIFAAMLGLLPNMGAIAVVLLAPLTILAAPAGVLFGSAAAALCGAALSWRALNLAHDGGSGLDVGERLGPRQLAWTLLAMSCFSSYVLSDAFWAPRSGSGVLASLAYAQRIVIGIGALVLAGPSAILTPRFAARLRDDGIAMFIRDVSRTTFLVGALAMGSALVLGLAATPMIEFVFARGAFREDDIISVASVFRSMLPGYCAMLVAVVLTRAIYCLRAVERPMAMVGLGWSILYFCCSGLLLRLGGIGFGISYSLSWFAYAVFAMLILRHYTRREG